MEERKKSRKLVPVAPCVSPTLILTYSLIPGFLAVGKVHGGNRHTICTTPSTVPGTKSVLKNIPKISELINNVVSA